MTGLNPPAKRQLIVVGKGHQVAPLLSPGQTSTAEIDLPALRVSFDASDGEVLACKFGGPLLLRARHQADIDALTEKKGKKNTPLKY